MNRIQLSWWDSNPTANWKYVDDAIHPPFYFHYTKIVLGNMSLFNNRPSVVFLIISFFRCRVILQNIIGVNKIIPPLQHRFCCLLQKRLEPK